jgi:putative SOS response-associated peptidase YedK
VCYYNSITIKKGTKISLKGKTKELPEINRPLQSGFEYGNWSIIKSTNDDYDFELAHWELIAPWIKNSFEVMKGRERFNTLNATAESLLESKLFKQPALKRRCLVLSSGFYEWRHLTSPGSKKDITHPYHISVKNQPYFFMAGIYQPWVDIDSGEMMNTFSIVTTKANKLMEQIHNKKKRMPTILNNEQASLWLSENLNEFAIKELATTQIEDNLLEAYTIKKDFRTNIDPKEPYTYLT